MKLIRQGSSKDIYELPHSGLLLFKYSNRVSVFDVGPMPISFIRLGRWRNLISNKLFRLLNQADFATTFFDSSSDNRSAKMLPLNIPELGLNFEKAIGRLMLAEIIFRFVITPKLMGRIERGEVDRSKIEAYLQGAELKVGARFHTPFIVCTTKVRAADVYISDEEAAKLCGISHSQLLDFYRLDVVRIANFLRLVFKSAGFDPADGKFEAGINTEGKFILADSISPDELRLIGHDGNSYDKEPIRRWYEENHTDWVSELKRTKDIYPDDKSKWPPYPATPPQELVDQMVSRYEAVAEALGAIED